MERHILSTLFKIIHDDIYYIHITGCILFCRTLYTFNLVQYAYIYNIHISRNIFKGHVQAVGIREMTEMASQDEVTNQKIDRI